MIDDPTVIPVSAREAVMAPSFAVRTLSEEPGGKRTVMSEGTVTDMTFSPLSELISMLCEFPSFTRAVRAVPCSSRLKDDPVAEDILGVGDDETEVALAGEVDGLRIALGGGGGARLLGLRRIPVAVES